MMTNDAENAAMKNGEPSETDNIKRKDVSRRVIKILYARSGCQCAYPCCQEPLFDEYNINISEICHIEGVKPGSARYNPNLNEDEVNDVSNLILLCKKHHFKIDHDSSFTVSRLKQMKEEHERWVQSRLSDDEGKKFRKKLHRIFQKYKFDELFSCQIFDGIFELQVIYDIENGCEDIRGLLRKKCAWDIPEGLKSRLWVFTKRLKELIKGVEEYSVLMQNGYVIAIKHPGDEEVENTHRIMNELASEYVELYSFKNFS